MAKTISVKINKEKTKNATKIILKALLLTGGVAIASTSPYFLSKAVPRLIKLAIYKARRKRDYKNYKAANKQYVNSFYYLKKQGLIKIKNRNGQIYISLTKEGKEKAGKYQIDNLEIKKPKKWDKKWRILIFDIEDNHKIKREALRGKIKELGLFQLQKSVWAHPYDFKKEMDLLRNFFGFKKDEVNIITAIKIESDEKARQFFGL